MKEKFLSLIDRSNIQVTYLLIMCATCLFLITGCGMHANFSHTTSEYVKARDIATVDSDRRAANKKIQTLCNDFFTECMIKRSPIIDAGLVDIPLVISTSFNNKVILQGFAYYMSKAAPGATIYDEKSVSNLGVPKSPSLGNSSLSVIGGAVMASSFYYPKPLFAYGHYDIFLAGIMEKRGSTSNRRVLLRSIMTVPEKTEIKSFRVAVAELPLISALFETLDEYKSSSALARKKDLFAYSLGWLAAEQVVATYKDNSKLRDAVKNSIKERQQEAVDWKSIATQNSIKRVQKFISKYENTRFATIHRASALKIISELIVQKKDPIHSYVELKEKYLDLPMPTSLAMYFEGPDGLTPYDIKNLLEKGMMENFISQKILSSKGQYRIYGNDEFFKMINFGLSDKIIAAMMQSTQNVDNEKAYQQQLAVDKRRRMLAQQERQNQIEEAREKNRSNGGFQWGKFAALATGAVAGGIGDMDAQTQANLITGFAQDSMEGKKGVSNSRNMANLSSQQIKQKNEAKRKAKELKQQRQIEYDNKEYQEGAARSEQNRRRIIMGLKNNPQSARKFSSSPKSNGQKASVSQQQVSNNVPAPKKKSGPMTRQEVCGFCPPLGTVADIGTKNYISASAVCDQKGFDAVGWLESVQTNICYNNPQENRPLPNGKTVARKTCVWWGCYKSLNGDLK